MFWCWSAAHFLDNNRCVSRPPYSQLFQQVCVSLIAHHLSYSTHHVQHHITDVLFFCFRNRCNVIQTTSSVYFFFGEQRKNETLLRPKQTDPPWRVPAASATKSYSQLLCHFCLKGSDRWPKCICLTFTQSCCC